MSEEKTSQLANDELSKVQTLKSFQASESTLRGILESVPDGIAVVDLDGNFIEANKALLQLHGYKDKSELMKRSITDLIARDTRELVWDSMKELLLTMGYVGAIEFNMMDSHGEEFLVEMSAALLKDEQGNPTGFVSITKDVTRRKRAENALRDSEARNRAIISTIPDMMFVMNRNGTFLDFVPSAIAAPVVPPERFLRANVSDILPPDVAGMMLKLIKKALDTGATQSIEYQIEYPKGARDYEARIAVYGQDTVLGITRDITDKKHAEEEIRKLGSAVAQSIDGIAISDLETRFVFVNQAYAQIHGYTVDEMLGMKVERIHSKKQQQEFRSRIGQIQQEGSWVGEIGHMRKDGSTFPTFMTTTLLKDDQGNPIGVLALARDISERKKAAKKLDETQQKLVRAEKLAAIGQLASGIAHELRNPLAVINNAAYFLKMKMGGEDAVVDKHLGIMEREVFRSSGIIAGLLDFARTREPISDKVDLDKFVEDILSKLSMPKGVNMTYKLQLDGLIMSIDIEQIKRVLLNIINNAIQAMPDGGNLTIQTQQSDGYVEVEVSDTGVGISQKLRSRIFEPLFTTRSEKGGTGIGLSICKSIVEAHHGSINVKSSVGKGTTFTVSLPAADR